MISAALALSLKGDYMNNSYIANEIKQRLNSRDVFKAYGIETNSKGFAVCPFHNEKTASFKVYNGDRGYYCFGCGESGDIIDFVKKFFNIAFNEALQKLNQDFGLGLPIGKRLTYLKRLEISKKAYNFKKNKEAEKQQLDRLKQDRDNLLSEWIRLDKQGRKYRPKATEIDIHPLFVEYLLNISRIEFELECAEMRLYQYETRNSCDT